MSNRPDTVKLVTSYYEAFNRGDVDGMLSHVADDIVHDVNQGERRRGKKLFGEFCHHMNNCYGETLTDIVVMASEDGKRASAEFVVNGTYKYAEEGLPPANGQSYKLPAGAFLAVENGKITRVTTYYNLQEWIAQVAEAA